jgi:hypothetical protein
MRRRPKRKPIISALLVILIAGGALYYFYSYQHRDISTDIRTVEGYAGDAATTSAVLTALGLNKQLSDSDIHVETSNNKVTLSGQVPSADDKRLAEEIAQGTKGVASVVNNLQVDLKVRAQNATEAQSGK